MKKIDYSLTSFLCMVIMAAAIFMSRIFHAALWPSPFFEIFELALAGCMVFDLVKFFKQRKLRKENAEGQN